MKNAVYVHKEYCWPELKNMLTNATLAFDTNVLLGFYSYSTQALEEIKILLQDASVKPRLFIPYHTAEEFYKNQSKVIQGVQSKYTAKLGSITTAINSLQQDINKSHCLYEWVTVAKTLLGQSVEAIRAEYERQGFEPDGVTSIIENIFSDGCVGEELDGIEVYEDKFEQRIRYNMPPGTTDRQKQQNKSGDFIIWSELLKKAKTDHTDIIFITNEKKFDWWEEAGKERPSSQLLIEFNKKTGQRCYFFNMVRFLNLLAGCLGYSLTNIGTPSENNEQNTIFAEARVALDEAVATEAGLEDQAVATNSAG